MNITTPSTNARYVRVNITANSGWPAGQVSELEVYPSGSTPPNAAMLSTNPSSLTFASQALDTTSAAQAVTVTNTGNAAASVSGVTVSGDYTQTNNCATIAIGASCTVNVSFRPTASGTRTGTVTVTSNATNSPTSVALSGTGAGSTSINLAAGRPTSESSHSDVYPSGNVTDGNQNSYWESANNAFPQWVQVDLGSAQSASRVVLQLPASWGARNETLSVLGSTDGTNFTTIVPAASYSFAPGNNNTVTITFAATSRGTSGSTSRRTPAGPRASSPSSRSGTSDRARDVVMRCRDPAPHHHPSNGLIRERVEKRVHCSTRWSKAPNRAAHRPVCGRTSPWLA